MQTVAIDTLAYTKELQESGFTPQQAERQSKALNDVLINFQNKNLEQLATKADLQAAIIALRSEVGAMISKTETNLIKWGVSLFVAQFLALVALLKLF